MYLGVYSPLLNSRKINVGSRVRFTFRLFPHFFLLGCSKIVVLFPLTLRGFSNNVES